MLGEMVAWGIGIASLLLVIAIAIGISITAKVRAKGVYRTILGFQLAAIWMILTLINNLSGDPFVEENLRTPQTAALLTEGIILAGILLIHSSARYHQKHASIGRTVSLLGWFLLGAFFGQVIDPSTNFAYPVDLREFHGYTFHPVFLSLLIIWGVGIIYLLTTVEEIEEGGHTRTPLRAAKIVGLGGLMIVVTQPIQNLMDFGSEFRAMIFIIGRLAVLLGIIFYFITIWEDPLETYPPTRSVKNLFRREQVSFALFVFEATGPEIAFHRGFGFFGEGDRKMSRLGSLGIAAMVVLGRGDEYIEQSAIFPVKADEDQVAIAMGKWIADGTQKDQRMNGKSYINLVLTVPEPASWLFNQRTFLEKRFHEFVERKGRRSNLTADDCKAFIRESLQEVALRI